MLLEGLTRVPRGSTRHLYGPTRLTDGHITLGHITMDPAMPLKGVTGAPRGPNKARRWSYTAVRGSYRLTKLHS